MPAGRPAHPSGTGREGRQAPPGRYECTGFLVCRGEPGGESRPGRQRGATRTAQAAPQLRRTPRRHLVVRRGVEPPPPPAVPVVPPRPGLALRQQPVPAAPPPRRPCQPSGTGGSDPVDVGRSRPVLTAGTPCDPWLVKRAASPGSVKRAASLARRDRPPIDSGPARRCRWRAGGCAACAYSCRAAAGARLCALVARYRCVFGRGWMPAPAPTPSHFAVPHGPRPAPRRISALSPRP